MKSLLVDVLRQAKDGSPTRTLSDSGSYDTTQSEVVDTANDLLGTRDSGQSDDELKLFETSASLEAVFDQSANEDAADGELGEIAASNGGRASGADTQSPSSAIAAGNVPALAKFTPVACLAAAFLAAAFWVGYQHLALKYAAPEIATTQALQPGNQAAENDGAVNTTTQQRFPFINAAIETNESESEQ